MSRKDCELTREIAVGTETGSVADVRTTDSGWHTPQSSDRAIEYAEEVIVRVPCSVSKRLKQRKQARVAEGFCGFDGKNAYVLGSEFSA